MILYVKSYVPLKNEEASHFALLHSFFLPANQPRMLSQVKQCRACFALATAVPKSSREDLLESRKGAGNTRSYLPAETAENFNFRPLISPDTKIVKL